MICDIVRGMKNNHNLQAADANIMNTPSKCETDWKGILEFFLLILALIYNISSNPSDIEKIHFYQIIMHQLAAREDSD